MGDARLDARSPFWAAALACLGLGFLGCSSDSIGAGASSPPPSPDGGGPFVGEAVDSRDATAEATAARDAVGGAVCASAPLFPVCSDGQIFAILAAEFAAHVDLANAVRGNLASAGAIDLAEKLITDDSVLAVQVEGEVRETGIATVPGGVDRAIAAETQEAVQALAAEGAPALDASYVDREVLSHLRALGLIERVLAPSVHDPRVTDLLARVRDLAVQHAQAAFQAQSELEGPCASRPE